MRTVQLTANNAQSYGSFYEATRIPIVEFVGRHAPTAKSGDLDRPTWCTVEPALRRVWQLEQRLQTVARWWTKGARERMLTHFSHDADREHGILESAIIRAHAAPALPAGYICAAGGRLSRSEQLDDTDYLLSFDDWVSA